MGKIEITHWCGSVLYTHQPSDEAGLTVRHALEAAMSAKNDLRGADLRDAVLSDADLRDAVLRGAEIYGIKITRAPLVLTGLHWDVTVIDGHIKIGCQLHEISAWAGFDDAQIAAMDGRHALRFWREHKAAIMMLASKFVATAVDVQAG